MGANGSCKKASALQEDEEVWFFHGILESCCLQCMVLSDLPGTDKILSTIRCEWIHSAPMQQRLTWQ